MKNNLIGLNPEAIEALQVIEKKKSNGQELDFQTSEALKAIDIASNLIDSVMSGRHVDLVFFQHVYADIIKKFQDPLKKPDSKKKIKKKRKLYFKDKE